MSLDEEIDFLVEKKSAPKQGRRATKPSSPESTEELLDSALDSINQISSSSSNFRPQKSSGWADEGTKLTKNKTPIEDKRFQDQAVIDFNNDNDMPVIPDVDEIQEDILRPIEMKAPTILVNTSTYKELAKELTQPETPSELFYLTKANDIDLSLLTESLCLEQDVKELDEEWTMESLFNDFLSVNTSL